MSEDQKSSLKIWLGDNSVTVFGTVFLAALSWANHSQLDSISLKQDKAILQTQAEAAEKFVAKTWYQSDNASLHAADAVNAAAISTVANSVSDIKTSIAVLTAEVQRQNK